MGALVVEVLDRHARVRARHKFDEGPVRIGRAYTNDVIIDDDYVSPEHIRIEQSEGGEWVARDLGSVNGLFKLQPARRADAVALDTETRLRVGHTVLRIRRAEFAVPETKLDLAGTIALSRFFNSIWSFFIVGAVLVVILFANAYFTDYTGRTMAQIMLDDVILALGYLLLWVGVWSVISRINSHRFYFTSHAVIAGSVMILAFVLNYVDDVYRFAFSAELSADLLEYSLAFLLLFSLFFSHLRYCTQGASARVALTSVAISAVLIGVGVLNQSIQYGDVSQLSYGGQLWPDTLQLVDSRTVDDFVQSMEGLRVRVERLRDGE